MSIVKIENVRVLDPIQKTDQVQTVYIKNGKFVDSADQIDETIDGQGKWLMPTMVDLCARLREPGQQQHGTLKSEGKAVRAWDEHMSLLHQTQNLSYKIMAHLFMV